MTSQMRKWITCSCNRNGITYCCFRPEYWVSEDFTKNTNIYPCMEKKHERIR